MARLIVVILLSISLVFFSACSVKDTTEKSLIGQQAAGFDSASQHIEDCKDITVFAEDACYRGDELSLTLQNGGRETIRGLKVIWDGESYHEENVELSIRRSLGEYEITAPFKASRVELIPLIYEGNDPSVNIAAECSERVIVLEDIRPC